MHIVMGATGHVGSVVAEALHRQGGAGVRRPHSCSPSDSGLEKFVAAPVPTYVIDYDEEEMVAH